MSARPWREGQLLGFYGIQAIAQQHILVHDGSDNRVRRRSWLALKQILTI